ncbi:MULTISPECIES: replication initiation protein [unclassified Salinisphaera]|jgi:plasmid replication initiation protein|uniref:replication initiation protein n=1 Tax=unclassified Salinisphaera TaxID=2649847 RepID=UPI0025F078C0|nr:replication initiation protein [Salinisphaera sp.]
MKAQQKMFGAELAEGHDSRSQPRASILQKRVNAVHWSAPFTLKERQCANVLLENAMSEEAGHESVDSFKKRREYRIYLPDLVEALFGNRGNRDRIKRTLDGLLNKRVDWAVTGRNASKEWGASTWLGGYVVRDRYLYYSYSPQLVDAILEPQLYARLNVSIQNRIRSNHTQCLYENCARYRDPGATRVWTIDEFRRLMRLLDRRSYKDFKNLNRAVIKPAVKEINEQTELFVKLVTKQQGNAVIGLYFEISENAAYDGP